MNICAGAIGLVGSSLGTVDNLIRFLLHAAFLPTRKAFMRGANADGRDLDRENDLSEEHSLDVGSLRLSSGASEEFNALMQSAPYFGHLKKTLERELSRYQSALDLGCGPEIRDLRILREMGVPFLVGIDMGQKPDPCVRGDTICFVRADIDSNHLPAVNESFDLVIIDNVIEHMYNPRRVLEECIRVLRKGGVLAVMTPNQARLINRLRLILGKSVHYPIDYWMGARQDHICKRGDMVFAGHIREYTVDELKRMLNSVSFEVVSVNLYPAAVPSPRLEMSKSRAILTMYNIAEKVIPDSGYMISMLARKK
jgi:SAM-dependent methyltransferase